MAAVELLVKEEEGIMTKNLAARAAVEKKKKVTQEDAEKHEELRVEAVAASRRIGQLTWWGTAVYDIGESCRNIMIYWIE
jgi:hypothetical protein